MITLLVLELDVPDSAARLLEDLRAEWPSFLGYLVSFAFIGGVWVGRHQTPPLSPVAQKGLPPPPPLPLFPSPPLSFAPSSLLSLSSS
ncbi:TMEM175 family protein, partial [Rhodococcus aetherivorans]|uniref:TMEM175 family protein n=1 Tax=Rhodococcus aetherivorans TaxID=191292 RepID=UPI00365429AF